jgi:DNA-binding response OmpR family regulator
MRVLLVEDEDAIAAFVRQGLEEAGYAVDLALDGAEALHWAAIADFDVVILDLMLPDIGGLEVCAELRRRGVTTPVLMLTARDTVEDRVAGLDSGADDYLIKPFAFAELLARLRALLRREPALTSKECSLLEFLMRHPNQTLTRATIAEHVWNYDFDNLTNLIDVHIYGLRRKIDDAYEPKLLHTIRGVGYRLGLPPS